MGLFSTPFVEGDGDSYAPLDGGPRQPLLSQRDPRMSDPSEGEAPSSVSRPSSSGQPQQDSSLQRVPVTSSLVAACPRCQCQLMIPHGARTVSCGQVNFVYFVANRTSLTCVLSFFQIIRSAAKPSRRFYHVKVTTTHQVLRDFISRNSNSSITEEV